MSAYQQQLDLSENSMSKKPRLKLCVIVQSHFAAVMGGAQYQARIIVEELVKRTDYEIIYLANNVSEKFKPDGYSIRKISDISGGIARFTAFADRSALLSLLEEIDPDVIYQNALTPHTGFAARFAAERDKRFIFHIASDFDVLPWRVFGATWKRRIMEMFEKKYASYGLKKQFTVIAQTQRQADLLEKHYKRPADIILQNLLEKPAENIDKSAEEIVIAWVANFKPVKQPEVFLKLAQALEDRPHVRFVMAGRPAHDMDYQNLHKEIESQSNLDYVGEISVDEVDEILCKSHILVNTSVTEGYSNTYVQAWMRYVPVVSLNADVDGLLARGELGKLGGSFDGLVEAVRSLVDDNELRQQLAENSRAYSFEHNTLDNVNGLIKLIEA